MKRSTRNIWLVVMAAILILTPIYLNFFSSAGELDGSDDKGSRLIEQLSTETERKSKNPSVQLGYEPDEDAEVWFFVGQIALGILIFGLGVYALDRHRSRSSKHPKDKEAKTNEG